MPLEDKSVARVHSTRRQATEISFSWARDAVNLPFSNLRMSNMKFVDMTDCKKDATSDHEISQSDTYKYLWFRERATQNFKYLTNLQSEHATWLVSFVSSWLRLLNHQREPALPKPA